MGRLIDADRLKEVFSRNVVGGNAYFDLIDNAPTVEAIPKAKYENRLKADLEAILVELQLEIEEKEQYYQDKFLESENDVHDLLMGGRMYGCGECKELIQKKIDKLKGDEE